MSGEHSDQPAHSQILIGVFVMRCIVYWGPGVGIRSLPGLHCARANQSLCYEIRQGVSSQHSDLTGPMRSLIGVFGKGSTCNWGPGSNRSD